jgi:hypothetical protein
VKLAIGSDIQLPPLVLLTFRLIAIPVHSASVHFADHRAEQMTIPTNSPCDFTGVENPLISQSILLSNIAAISQSP